MTLLAIGVIFFIVLVAGLIALAYYDVRPL